MNTLGVANSTEAATTAFNLLVSDLAVKARWVMLRLQLVLHLIHNICA